MFAFLSNMFVGSKLDGFVIDLYFTITSILSDDFDFTKFFSWRNLDAFSILEANLSWFIIIDNGNSSFGVLTYKLIICICIIELNKEVLIWLPVVIIIDFDLN